MNQSFFIVCPPGLESLTAGELVSSGILKSDAETNIPGMMHIEKGGLEFDGDLTQLYGANLHLRTASRILMRLAEFRAIGFSELRKKAAKIPWEQFLEEKQAVILRVSCHKSRLYHSTAVAERVGAAIGDRLGAPPPVVNGKDDDDELQRAQMILVRLLHDQCTISIDSSGELLHRRGYRQAIAKAPLRETLAAGMLLASGWDQQSPLIDPFCGSGAIPIEAALLARNIPPGLQRSFAFMHWKNFDRKLWEALREKALSQVRTDCPPVLASDRDAGAIDMAVSNAERAGVLQSIEFSCRALSAIEPVGKGWVVTNPPYGLRVSSNKDLRNLYAQFGNVMEEKCPGWRVAVLCSDNQLLRQSRLNLEPGFSTLNGGIPVRLSVGEVKQ